MMPGLMHSSLLIMKMILSKESRIVFKKYILNTTNIIIISSISSNKYKEGLRMILLKSKGDLK